MKEVTITKPITDLCEIENWCRRTWGRPGLVWKVSLASHWGRSSGRGEVSWTWSFTREEEYVMFTLTWCY